MSASPSELIQDVSRHVVCWASWFLLVEFLAFGDEVDD
jgi:hypothetical protein